MSLLTVFELLDRLDQDGVEQLEQRCCVGGLEASLISHGKSTVWSITETGDEDMLIDDAHWDSLVWKVHPFAVVALLDILAHMLEASPKGLNFSMTWVDERVESVSVSLDELRAVFTSGEFGTKTQYEYRAL